MVLITILVASLLLARFMERTTTELLVEARAAQAVRLRGDAYSALEVTLAVLADYRAADGGLWAPAQGWGDPFAWARYEPRAGVTVAVAFEDESGKPSLPRLDTPGLQNLGELLGLAPDDAARLADALLTWTQPDHVPATLGSDLRSYERADPPHHPPQRALRSFDELAAIAVARDFFYDKAGHPTELRAQFAQSVSLYDYPAANLNAGQPLALAFAGLDETQSRRLTDYLGGRTRPRGTPPFFRSAAETAAILGAGAPGLGTEVRCLRIRVRVREGAAVFGLTAVVSPPGGAVIAAEPSPDNAAKEKPAAPGPAKSLAYPFTILDLQETMEPLAAPGGAA
ncbi:type II secretion system protein GspK [Opitutus sp. GAS368]|uniref:type II secretion system protein GspK n=1 Tax=Opitutus sp. GAS368 TaxID=1882749 RepID=UPI00087AFF4C|nr:type II secretion system protein GspK [Opitutus sp. GAS368]SDS41994.1 general secretion pathway protein K [Opitutus sp. GAS368]